jgi:hypothetical protein
MPFGVPQFQCPFGVGFICVEIHASLVPNPPAGLFGGYVQFSPFVTITSGGAAVLPAKARVVGNLIPEPSTLLTFGTGLLGLAAMMRRKLKLGT